MREFADIQRELGLQKFLDSPLGTLYFVPFAPNAPRVIVRHFDRELPSRLVIPFADLLREAQHWIERDPTLVRLVSIEQPLEVGRDFIARKHHTYQTATDSYVEWEDPPEPPEELEEMRTAFQHAVGNSKDPRDAVIETVLARSILEATGKTYFDETASRFVVVEPKVTRDDLERWSNLSKPT